MAPYFGLKGSKLHAAVWAEACVAVAIFGFNGPAGGGVLSMPAFRRQFPDIDVQGAPLSEQHSKSVLQGTVIALLTLFGTFGALACTLMGDTLGRRKTVWVAAAVQLIGDIIMGTSYSLGQFIVGRIITGLGTGGIIATVSVWQSELSKASSRGRHVSAFGIFTGIGICLALWVAFGMSFAPGSVSWRFTLAFPGIFSIVVLATIMLLPESPRWLMLKDRHEEATVILNLLYPGAPDVVDKEIKDIDLALRLSVNHAGLKSLFSMGPQRIFHRVMLGSIAQMMLQMTGVNAVSYYAQDIYETLLHFPRVEAGAIVAASNTCFIIGSIICSFTVDRFGRRKLMMFSAGGMAICFAIIVGLTSESSNSTALKASVAFFWLYYLIYTCGWLGLPFLYASEIAPIQLRAAVAGISTAVSWLFNFLVAEITPVGFNDIGYRYLIVYTILNASFVPIIYFFFPETANRDLEELDAVFAQSKSIFDTVGVARRMPRMHLTDAVDEKDKLAGDSDHVEVVKQEEDAV